MKATISSFLQQKNLSKNTQLAYQYDLQQFLAVCDGQVSAGKMEIYQAFLKGLKPTAQRRKLSAVNQFLYFLYENGQIESYIKLSLKEQAAVNPKKLVLEDLSDLWKETDLKAGQLIALLIACLGLTPGEIATIRQTDLDLNFGILTVEREQIRRVLNLPKDLLPYLGEQTGKRFLFDKKGKTYSRQWFFNHLSTFTASIGHPDWTAQKLREQYIVHELSAGKSLEDLAKRLGLKSMTSLEKFRNNGY